MEKNWDCGQCSEIEMLKQEKTVKSTWERVKFSYLGGIFYNPVIANQNILR